MAELAGLPDEGASRFRQDGREKDDEQMQPASRNEWRLNWWLVAAGTVSMFVTTVPPGVIGVFIQPLETAFGWSRTSITSAVAMTMLVSAFFSPMLGVAIQRYGARWIGFCGMALTPLFFASLAFVTSQIWVYLGIWFLISCAIALGGIQPWTTAVSRAFTHDRGLALGLAIAGASLAGAISPPLSAYLVATYGWRAAYAILGLGCFAIFVPIAFLLIRGRSPIQTDAKAVAVETTPVEPDTGMTPREALRSRNFWQLQAGLVLGCMVVNGMAVNFIPMLTARSLTTIEAAGAMTALGIGAFVGKFLVGWLMDRIHPPLVVVITRLAGAATAFFLLYVEHHISMGLAYAVGFIAGIAVGGEIPETAFLSARQFGMAHFQRLYAWTFAGNRVSSAIGPVVLALLYDLHGDYRWALGMGAGLLVVSALLIATLGPPTHSSRAAR